MAYLELNDVLSDSQYGFRQKRSNGDLLVYATDYWGEAVEKYREALAFSLDISNAFDMVWHASLLSKLRAYGIPERLWTWINDFLSERTIPVFVDGCASEPKAINGGVPKGSVLLGTLLLLHINDLLLLLLLLLFRVLPCK